MKTILITIAIVFSGMLMQAQATVSELREYISETLGKELFECENPRIISWSEDAMVYNVLYEKEEAKNLSNSSAELIWMVMFPGEFSGEEAEKLRNALNIKYFEIRLWSHDASAEEEYVLKGFYKGLFTHYDITVKAN